MGLRNSTGSSKWNLARKAGTFDCREICRKRGMFNVEVLISRFGDSLKKQPRSYVPEKYLLPEDPVIDYDVFSSIQLHE